MKKVLILFALILTLILPSALAENTAVYTPGKVTEALFIDAFNRGDMVTLNMQFDLDLSENAEYKEAKREKNRNESRIRYLKSMIATAKVVEAGGDEGKIGLFDYAELFYEMNGQTKRIQIVTTLSQDATKGFISRESPLGKALLGKKVGDRVTVQVTPDRSFTVVVKSVEKGEDNEDLPISSF